MTDLPSRAPSGTPMQDLKWSAAEKVIARKAFNLALERELQAVILKPKARPRRFKSRQIFGTWNTTSLNAGTKSIAYTTTATRSSRSFLRISSATAA